MNNACIQMASKANKSIEVYTDSESSDDTGDVSMDDGHVNCVVPTKDPSDQPLESLADESAVAKQSGKSKRSSFILLLSNVSFALNDASI